MAEYRLHCFAQSGNAYKAALMLNLCGADWEPVFVDFFNGATRTPEFRELNEMGEVPVLEFEGTRLTQSGVTSPTASASSAGPTRTSAARSCAGCSGTTTSSRATSARCASSSAS
jgi:hypothetical protein